MQSRQVAGKDDERGTLTDGFPGQDPAAEPTIGP